MKTLVALLIAMLAISAWTESACPLCAMIFTDDYETVAHISHHHPCEKRVEYRRATPAHENRNKLIYEEIKLRTKNVAHYQGSDFVDGEHVWNQDVSSIKIDYAKREILIDGQLRYYACDAALMLFALDMHDVKAVKELLKEPKKLADLEATDRNNRNAYLLARDIRDAYTYASADHEIWTEIVEDLAAIFRFPWHSDDKMVVADFIWRPLMSTGACYEFAERSEFEAKCMLPCTSDDDARAQEWWGHCHLFSQMDTY